MKAYHWKNVHLQNSLLYHCYYNSNDFLLFLENLKEKFPEDEILFFQSNVEGEIINRLQKDDYEALIINPAAYTHYSYAIADCLRNIQKPKIEIHISNIYAREEFRQKSVTAAHCSGVISGFGLDGYRLAVLSLK